MDSATVIANVFKPSVLIDGSKKSSGESEKQVPTGDWIQTFSGGKFYPLDPRPDQVKIEDIAHALSNLCRFAGHVREFYSVAQHSVLVSHFCKPEFALWGLLHDAPEAYICDLPRPVKYHSELAAYKIVEKRLEEAIVKHFGLSPSWEPNDIKWTDRRLLFTERRDLLPELPWDSDGWAMGLEGKAFPFKIVPWAPKYAEELFLLRFKELTDAN